MRLKIEKMEQFSFLIVTQDEKLKKALKRELVSDVYKLLFIPFIREVLPELEKQVIDLLIIDQSKENKEEVFQLFNNITGRYPSTIRILLPSSSLKEEELIHQLNQGNIQKFIPQSLPPSEMKEAIEQCLHCLYPLKNYKRKINLLQNRLKELNEIGISLSSEHNLSVLLDKLLKEARKITNSEAGSLYIVKENELSFEVAQNDYIDRRKGSHKKPFSSFTLPLSTESIAGYVALTGKILNIEDAYEIPKDCPYSFNIEVDKKTGYRSKSMLVVPMKNEKEEIIGVVQLINSLDSKGKIAAYDIEDEHAVLSLASQAAVSICNASLLTDIKQLLSSLIEYSSSLIDARSRHTAGHSHRVALYTMEIAKAINRQNEGHFASIFFSPEEMEELRFSAYLHDIGKIGVPERVLDKRNKLNDEHIELIKHRFDLIKALYQASYLKDKAAQGSTTGSDISSEEELKEKMAELEAYFEFIKKINISSSLMKQDIQKIKEIAQKEYTNLQGKKTKYLSSFEVENLSISYGNLTDKEREEIENHINYTITILSKIPFPKDLRNVPFFAGSHHERLDGGGYPRGMKSEQLPLQCRILAFVDYYEALTAPDRPYRKPLPREKALQILKEEAERGRYDNNIIELIEKENLLKL